jgi:hypothetical protein
MQNIDVRTLGDEIAYFSSVQGNPVPVHFPRIAIDFVNCKTRLLNEMENYYELEHRRGMTEKARKKRMAKHLGLTNLATTL